MIFPKNAHVDHLGITVKPENWDAAVKAYTELLGFEMKKTWEGEIASGEKIKYCFLSSTGHDDFYIELLEDTESEGQCELCIRVTDLEAIYDELKAKGVTLTAGTELGALPPGKKWFALGTRSKLAYMPPEPFKGAFPPMGIELSEYEVSMKEKFNTKVGHITYGP